MGYKMKHKKGKFPFKSPLKISDRSVVEAQRKLDHVELDFREPGWAKAAKKVHGAAVEVATGGAKGLVGGGDSVERAEQDESQTESVSNIMENMPELESEGL